MIRNLKILMLAAMAVAAFGAISASGASAAEYHCETAGASCILTLSPDGTSKTAHHVFIVRKEGKSGSVTCNGLDAQATGTKTATELTLTNLNYTGCNLAGTEATIDTTGCDYLFNSNGGKVNVVCEGANKIKITAGACTVEIGSQALAGITYTNIATKEDVGPPVVHTPAHVTVSTEVKNVDGFAKTGCLGLLGFENTTFTEGEYTTGNTLVKGFVDNAGAEGAQVRTWWE